MPWLYWNIEWWMPGSEMLMSNPALCDEVIAKSYEELTANFDWSSAEHELGYAPGGSLNIGWM